MSRMVSTVSCSLVNVKRIHSSAISSADFVGSLLGVLVYLSTTTSYESWPLHLAAGCFLASAGFLIGYVSRNQGKTDP